MNALLEAPATLATDDQADVRLLLRQVANGDRPAFRELHRRFSGMVYAITVQVLHNHEDAEDAVQEVFAQVWNKAGLFCDERGRPSTWISTLARNRAIDKIRSRERRAKLNHGFQQELLTVPPTEIRDASKETALRELAGQAQRAVMQLTPEQQQAIQMTYFSGLTQLEIAAQTGEPLGTIKARIRRGLSRLRSLVRE